MNKNEKEILKKIKSINSWNCLIQAIPFHTDLSQEFLLNIVKRNGDFLEHISYEKQSKDLCLAAVKSNPFSLRYVKNKTKQLCKVAVSKYPGAICYVENPSLDLMKIVLKKEKEKLKEAKGYSEQDALEILKIDPKNIQFLKEKSYDLCLYAILRMNNNDFSSYSNLRKFFGWYTKNSFEETKEFLIQGAHNKKVKSLKKKLEKL